MAYCVVIDAGKYDAVIFESASKIEAKKYRAEIKPFSKVTLKLKNSKKVRHIKEDFVTTDVLVSLSI